LQNDLKNKVQAMEYNQYKIKAKVWLYHGKAAWHFVTIPKDVSAEINELFEDQKRGWGSLPVVITVGNTVWKTSIFPDKKAGIFLLPIKSVVRKKEKIESNSSIDFLLEIRAEG
jgi:hypothetical protein